MGIQNKLKLFARLSGLSYLGVILFGIFAHLYVRSSLIVDGNAFETAKNISENMGLFRAAFVSDIAMMFSFFLLTIFLFSLLKYVNKNIALIMVFFNLVSIAIIGINLINHFAAMALVGGEEYLSGFSSEQINGLMMFFLNLHKNGYFIAQVFFSTWLFPLGYLFFKSKFMPKLLGIILMVGSVFYAIDTLLLFAVPSIHSSTNGILLILATIAEFGTCLWLLIKGTNSKKLY